MKKLALDSPATYRIEAQGHLNEHWSDWFDGTAIDQAALHGLLRKLYRLGLPLLSIHRVKPGQANGVSAGQSGDASSQ